MALRDVCVLFPGTCDGDGESIPDYPGGWGVITEASTPGRQGTGMRSEWHASKMEEGLQTKGCKWPREAGKGLETESLLGPPERASIVDALSLAQGDGS